MERYLYLLPTRDDGKLVTSEEMFEIEVAKMENQNSKSKLVLDFKVGRGVNPKKTLTFPGYSITNKFPDNVILMKNGSVVVCIDFINDLNTNVVKVAGHKMYCLEEAFLTPYISSRFHTFVASKPTDVIDLWNVNYIQGKMFTVPLNLTDYSVLPDILTCVSTKWFVTPLRHTLQIN